MKKLFNSRFLFILASSLVVLMILTIGAFYLFDDEDNVFVKSGYILNPLSSTSEKYFFDKDAGYKENLSSMIEFVDVDKNTVSVLKDSFLHYSDESLSFLKRGALLDLGSIKGNNAVSFYNISSESIIEKNDNSYNIAASNGDIRLTSFMGRISDNKYIVVGDLNLKMAGNETTVKGNYFEIVYIEEGIVNIENKDVKFQVAAADTVISLGQHIKIDLGNKKIMYDNEDIMSITAITIDGDENIEIIPKVETEEDKPDGGGAGDGVGEGTGGGAGSGNGQGDATNEDGENDGEVTDPGDLIVVKLKDAQIGSTDIDVVFEVLEAKETDNLKLQVVNLASGRTVDVVASVTNDALIEVNLLTPNTKYLFIVLNEQTNNKYFQKVLQTTGFGIKLEKEFATNNSLSYKITVDEGTDITDAKLTLYQFNEETKQNEVVKTSYVDSITGEVMYEEKVTRLSEIIGVTGTAAGEHSVLYSGLDSDTIYTAVLDEFSVASLNFKDIYNITLTTMTLKQIPTFNNMLVDKNVGSGSFDLSLSNIQDPDSAITSYTYLIYDKFTNELAIDPIVHTNASPINIKIGDGENELRNDTNYYYKVIIEYFDNEKYIEYVTSDSIIFMMGNDPYIKVVPNEVEIKHDRIAATIYLTDNSCLVSVPGREKCGGISSTVVEVSKLNAIDGEKILVISKPFDFLVEETEIKYDLYLDGLTPGTAYYIEVKSNLNNSVVPEKTEILHTDDSRRAISTKYLSSFEIKWDNYQSNKTHVVHVGTQLYAAEGTNTLSPSESLDTIGRVVIKLYPGRITSDVESYSPIAEKELNKKTGVNFKEILYDAMYSISSSVTFGLTEKDLKCLNAPDGDTECVDGKLNEYYTLTMDAYTSTGYPVTLINKIFPYRVNPSLLEDLASPLLKTEIIPNSELLKGKIFDKLSNLSTPVGVNISSVYDRNAFLTAGMVPVKIRFKVYNDEQKLLNFYILNEEEEKLELAVSEDAPAHLRYYDYVLDDKDDVEFNVYMDYGTSYEIEDEIMKRGNEFYVGYEFLLFIGTEEEAKKASDDQLIIFGGFAASEDPDSPSDGIYKYLKIDKETPNVKMHISKSDENSILYKYEVKDPDFAIYKTPEEDYSLLYTIDKREPVKVPLTYASDSDGFNHFVGEFRIENLLKNSGYKIFYNINSQKTGSQMVDVKPNYGEFGEKDIIFEGFYEAEKANFNYSIINDPTKDNKVGIRISDSVTDEFLQRIVSYKLEFTAKYDDGSVVKKDGNSAVLVKDLWKLTSCGDDKKTTRCLYVDYTELKKAGFQSEYKVIKDAYGNETQTDEIIKKNISVKVTAYYDNGLTGYDYTIGSEGDYQYIIMQDYITKTIEPDGTPVIDGGSYLSFNSNGKKLVMWNEKTNVSKGYYTYTVNGDQIKLNSQLVPSLSMSFMYTYDDFGYHYKQSTNNVDMYLNPKMVTVEEMGISGFVDTFYFDSITPKVGVSQKNALINGSILTLELSGIDLKDFRTDTINGKTGYYVYVETWNVDIGDEACNSSGCGGLGATTPVIPGGVPVQINTDRPTDEIYAYIEGLEEGKTYYHRVYAKMNQKGEKVYVRLFDSKKKNTDENPYENYTSTTLTPGRMTDKDNKPSLNINALDEPQGKKELEVKIKLKEYESVDFNFDLNYAVCKAGLKEDGTGQYTQNECGLEDGRHILKGTIPREELTHSISSFNDITENVEFVYGKDYFVRLYASFHYYVYDSDEKIYKLSESPKNVLINQLNALASIRKLNEPTFAATREAGIKNGKYYIDFSVTVDNADNTLIYTTKNEDGTIKFHKDDNGNYKLNYFVDIFEFGKEESLLSDASSCDVCLEIVDENGDYVKVDGDYAFNPKEIEKQIRITGLKADTKYSFRIYNDNVYINNATGLVESVETVYTVYTTNQYGVAIGKDVTYSATAKSIVVTFLGGSSFENVTKFEYTVGEWDGGTDSAIGDIYILSGVDKNTDKTFEYDSNSSNWRFVINPDNMKNELGKTYKIEIGMWINDNGTEVHLTSDQVPGFMGTATYSEDKKK